MVLGKQSKEQHIPLENEAAGEQRAFPEYPGKYCGAFHKDWNSDFGHFIRQERDPEGWESKTY